jgi:anthranilate synthase component 1
MQRLIRRTRPADLWTPIGFYRALSPEGPSFPFESVEGEADLARSSFIGRMPRCIYRVDGWRMEDRMPEGCRTYDLRRVHPFALWREALEALTPEAALEPLPCFIGGLAGYLGYEMAALFDRVPCTPRDALAFPDAILMQVEALLAFDHVTQTLSLFALAEPEAEGEAAARRAALEGRLQDPASASSTITSASTSGASWETRAAQACIAVGDAFQIVLARRWGCPIAVLPFVIYWTLQRLNPSPDLFFLHLLGRRRNGEDLVLISASPEMLVRVEGGEAAVRPIAGTRPRSCPLEEDRALGQEP